MSYSHLPLKERINMASDFALLLIEESLLEENIISNLQDVFSLSQDEAMTALLRTRQVHNDEYRRLNNASIYKAIGTLIASIVCGVFYLFISEGFGLLFVFLGLFFLVAGFATFTFLVQKTLDKYFYSPTLIQERIKRSEQPKKERQDWTVMVFTGTFCLLVAAFFGYYKKQGYVKVETLMPVSGLKLKDPLKSESTGGKSPRHYYVFHFENYPNEFHLFETYYNYAETFDESLFHPGDTMTIQVEPSDYYGKLYAPFKEGSVGIINIIKNGRPLVNLELRNQKKLANNQSFLLITGVVCALCFSIMLMRHKIAADKDRRNYPDTFCMDQL